MFFMMVGYLQHSPAQFSAQGLTKRYKSVREVGLN